MNEELRRISRVSVCCRVVVRDRYGVWTGVTEDISRRGCQIVTERLLRAGTRVNVTLSSDLFPEELELVGETVWAKPHRLGVNFVLPEDARGAPALEAWLQSVLEHGALPESAETGRVVPSVVRASARAATTPMPRGGRVALAAGGEGVVLPFRRE